jgi:hypothetical protein
MTNPMRDPESNIGKQVKKPSPAKVKGGPRPTASAKSQTKTRYTGSMMKPIASMEKGGAVRKTGLYRLHKGERVVAKNKLRKIGRKSGMVKLFASPPMRKHVPKNKRKRQYGKAAKKR